jgi:hypothetical protein
MGSIDWQCPVCNGFNYFMHVDSTADDSITCSHCRKTLYVRLIVWKSAFRNLACPLDWVMKDAHTPVSSVSAEAGHSGLGAAR